MKEITIANPTLIKNENFETIIITVIFPYHEKIEELAKQALLPAMLMYMNEEYPTEEEFQKALKENYIVDYFAKQITVGTTNFFAFYLIIPDKLTLKKDYIEKQISFLEKCLYHPKLINEEFDNFELDREKENLLIKLKNTDKSFHAYQTKKLHKLVDNEGIFSRSLYDHQDLIEKLTSKELYKFYQEKIKNNHPLIFILGNIEKQTILPIIKKYFPTLKEQETLKTNYRHYLKPFRITPQEITEEKNFKDSSLSLVYKVENMKEEDTILLGLLKNILTSQSTRLLNKKLRDEYNLVYSSSATFYPNFGIFEITAYINPLNKDLALEKILEVMNDIKQEKELRPLIEKIIRRRKTILIRSLDNKYSILTNEIYKKLDIAYTDKECYDLLTKVTEEDLLEFLSRLKLDTIYFLKEMQDEQNRKNNIN